MKIRLQMAMVMNLDKCIGCHTCSLPCKNVWTSRKGAEYIWYNNVETKPGIGYPRKWEDQDRHRGGWEAKNGRAHLRAGGPAKKLLNIFHNPDLPALDEYYEPWTYDYQQLTDSPPRRHQPAIRPVSQVTGEHMAVRWGPNWEDDLAGVHETGGGDINFSGLEYRAYLEFKKVFMFYLPRICEHCLNPACVASCPSGALYKRDEDGFVLVDQERCRGWRYCVSGCPYKKVYFNWQNGRSEKCIFCYPRVEAGLTPLCAETCVGRIRYIGPVFYDLDRVAAVAGLSDDRALHPGHTDLILDPFDPEVIARAREEGIPGNFIAAARKSPVYPLIKAWRLAFPPHPEFRTLPMVWYVPPLSPLVRADDDESEPGKMRIPVRYLANLLTAGDEAPILLALRRLLALRAYMRSLKVENAPQPAFLEKVGLSEADGKAMYRLLAVAKYPDRFVIPAAKPEGNLDAYQRRGEFGFADKEER